MWSYILLSTHASHRAALLHLYLLGVPDAVRPVRMQARFLKQIQVVGLVAVVLLVVFVFAWQSRLFGLGQQKETVIVPFGSRIGNSGSSGFLDVGGGTDSESATVARGSFRQLEIVTLLPFDAIPAIFNPAFVSVNEASNPDNSRDRYRPEEKVLGIEINGDVRAYSVPMLSRHEVVNDVVGGVPVAVTW